MRKQWKVRDVTATYARDLARCASHYLNIVPCPGGRPIVQGKLCPHCRMSTALGYCGGVAGHKGAVALTSGATDTMAATT
jgi:hypothetical protein